MGFWAVRVGSDHPDGDSSMPALAGKRNKWSW